jgi:hypothetical protein
MATVAPYVTFVAEETSGKNYMFVIYGMLPKSNLIDLPDKAI